MLRFLFRKQIEVEGLIEEYLGSIETAQDIFLRAIEAYLEAGGWTPRFAAMAAEGHKAESRSDDIQDRIVQLLYEKALIPDLRGDVLKLLETIDEIPDQFDRVLADLLTQKPALPGDLKQDLRELLAVSLETCSFAMESVRSLFGREERAARILCRADESESQGDHIERRILVQIFDSDWDPFLKILLRDLVCSMGDIADHAVQVCRQVNLIVIKRRV